VGDRRKLALALVLILFAITVAEGTEYTRTVPASEVLAKIKAGEPVDYDHVIIKGNLGLDQLGLPEKHTDRALWEISWSGLPENLIIVNSSIRIADSMIEGIVGFSNTIFEKSIDFTDTDFNSDAKFNDSNFNSDAKFIGSKFNNYASFETSEFNKYAHFVDSKFNGHANFGDSKFNEHADFRSSTFNGDAIFSASNFNSDADFSVSNFNGHADFNDSTFNSDANFKPSAFNGDADFIDSEFSNAFFGRTRFNSHVTFERSKFKGDADFSDVKFIGDANFFEVIFEKGTLILGQDSVFYGTLNLNGSNINSIDSYVRWNNLPHLEYNIKIYNILFDNYKKWRLMDDYNECYYKFRVETFKREPFGYGKFLDFVQWILYGFGLRPDFPILWSIAIILISGFIFYRTKSIQKSNTSSEYLTKGEAFIFSAIYFTSGASNIISSQPTEFSPIGKSRYVAILERLFGWVLFALFLASLGNTIAH
jgi:Pentapeptide repeats (9 copies)